jgi:hypothetical protein
VLQIRATTVRPRQTRPRHRRRLSGAAGQHNSTFPSKMSECDTPDLIYLSHRVVHSEELARENSEPA